MLLVDPLGQAAFGPINERFRLPALARQIARLADRLKAVHIARFQLHDRLETALDRPMGESFVQATHLHDQVIRVGQSFAHRLRHDLRRGRSLPEAVR